MAETCTFSALVDEVILRSQRRDRINDIVSYARSTIRECQVLAHFEQDLAEAQITVDVLPFVWERPQRLRALLAAKPNGITDRRGDPIWFKNKPPGEQTRNDYYYYYLSGDSFIFSGSELQVANIIDLAYFRFSRKFVYYAVDDRPATFDAETETWTYLPAYDVDADSRATGRELVENWLLRNWYDTLLEGALAKIFKSVGDQRNALAFSLYKSYQKDILKAERVISVNDHDANG